MTAGGRVLCGQSCWQRPQADKDSIRDSKTSPRSDSRNSRSVDLRTSGPLLVLLVAEGGKWWRRTIITTTTTTLLAPMPAADCRLLHHGRIMRCLTYLLLLPETLKKSRKVTAKLPAGLPVCYEILALSLTSKKRQQRQKMAAELYPAAAADGDNCNQLANVGTAVADADKAKEAQVNRTGGGGGGGCGGGEEGGRGGGDSGGGSSAATTPTTQHNINNNNIDPPSWQCSHPTLRER